MQPTITQFFYADGRKGILTRFLPQPAKSGGSLVPTPKTWLSSVHPVWRPPLSFAEGLGVHSPGLGRCQPSEVSDPQSSLSPSSQPGTSLFQAGKVANVHPFHQHAPLCAHPPQGIQAQTQHLICGSLSSPSSLSETESKEEAGSGSVPTRGRRVFPITAPSPAPPRSALPAPRRHLSPRRKGLCAGIVGTYRCGAGDEGRARQGRVGRPSARRRCGQERGLTGWLPLLLRAGTRGALLRRLFPAPTPGAPAPPAPSDRTRLPHATRPRLFPHPVSAAAGAARGPGSCSRCCPTEPSPKRRRPHSPIVRMRCKLHMLASDRRSAPGPV